jgi:O-antigen ligase
LEEITLQIPSPVKYVLIISAAILLNIINPLYCYLLMMCGICFIILKNYRLGIYILAALAFTQLASLTILEDYHVFLICFSLTVIAYSIDSLRDLSLRLYDNWILKWLIMFFLIIVFSGIYAQNGEFWLEETYAFARVFVLFFLIIQGINSEKSLLTMGRMIVLGLFISSIVSFMHVLGGNIHMLSVVFLRFLGNLSDPNDYAMTLIGALPLAVFFAKSEKKLLLRLFYLVCSISFLFFIIITQSRGGLLAALVTVSMIFFLIRRKWIVISVSLFCVFIIFSLFPAELIFYRIVQLFNAFAGKTLYDSSFLQRYILFKSAVSLFFEYPIFGVGANNFIVHVVRFMSPSLFAHNMFSEIAVDLGLLGFIPFALIVFSPFFWLPRLIKSAEMKGRKTFAEFMRFIRISLTGMIITSLFLSCQSKVYLWVMIAIVYVTQNIMTREIQNKVG